MRTTHTAETEEEGVAVGDWDAVRVTLALVACVTLRVRLEEDEDVGDLDCDSDCVSVTDAVDDTDVTRMIERTRSLLLSA